MQYRGFEYEENSDGTYTLLLDHGTELSFLSKKGVENYVDVSYHRDSAHMPGAKLDSGKPRVSLVIGGFASALEEVAKVATFGAEKYTDGGWAHVPNGVERYTDAMLRHYLKEEEELDEESSLPHAAHLAWNALARLELMIRENNNNND